MMHNMILFIHAYQVSYHVIWNSVKLQGANMPVKSSLLTTTVRLPKRLYEEARSALEKGEADASSLNDLLVKSLEEKLKQLRRESIDAEFAEMRDDAQYHRESLAIAKEFASSDGETLRLAEKGENP